MCIEASFIILENMNVFLNDNGEIITLNLLDALYKSWIILRWINRTKVIHYFKKLEFLQWETYILHGMLNSMLCFRVLVLPHIWINTQVFRIMKGTCQLKEFFNKLVLSCIRYYSQISSLILTSSLCIVICQEPEDERKTEMCIF